MGVFVLGMHRSGTSAVTRVVNLLGVPVGQPQMPPQPDNPAGFWEVATLADLNDEILGALGGSWDAPPVPRQGWEDDPGVASLRGRAEEAFRAAHQGPTWVWKDPRATLLLPFWRGVTGTRDVAVVVLRNPLDVAHSLNRRNGFPVTYGLALWERYMRALHRDARGMPCLVVRYDDVIDDPAPEVGRIAQFLDSREESGEPGELSHDAIAASIARSLRHRRHSHDDLGIDGRVSSAQRALYDAFDSTVGEHESLDMAPLPEETPCVEALVAAHREVATAPEPSPAAVLLGSLMEQLGSAERALGERDEEAVALRDAVASLQQELGGAGLGSVERAALRAARVLKRPGRRGRRDG